MPTICDGCDTKVDDNPIGVACMNCPSCPTERCATCGGWNVWATGDLCSCWESTDGMTLADLKALWADDCHDEGLSVALGEVH